jgi:hypothetical protein
MILLILALPIHVQVELALVHKVEVQGRPLDLHRPSNLAYRRCYSCLLVLLSSTSESYLNYLLDADLTLNRFEDNRTKWLPFGVAHERVVTLAQREDGNDP